MSENEDESPYRYYVGYMVAMTPQNPAGRIGGVDIAHKGPIRDQEAVAALQDFIRAELDAPGLLVINFSLYAD